MLNVVLILITRTPPGVWALLLALIAIGLLQLREQAVSRLRLLSLPRQVQPLADGRWRVGGSAAQLVLLMLIFWLRYAVAVALAITPGLATKAAFAGACCRLYGVTAGLPAAQALRVLGQRVHRPQPVPEPALAA